MSPTIRATPRSAAASCKRIDFVASRLLAAAWFGWLASAALVTLFADLCWIIRVSIALSVAVAGGRAVCRYVLLRGPRAIRALEWLEPGGAPVQFHLWLGVPARRLAAVPRGCCRYGVVLWVLRFDTAEGTHQLLVNPACQEPAILRRLSRRLSWDSG